MNAALLAQINARRSGGGDTKPKEPSGGNQTPVPSNSPADTKCRSDDEAPQMPSGGHQKSGPPDIVPDTKCSGSTTEPSTGNQQPSRINLLAEITRRGKATKPRVGDEQQMMVATDTTETPQTPAADNDALEEKAAVVDTETAMQVSRYKNFLKFGREPEEVLQQMAYEKFDISLLDKVFDPKDVKDRYHNKYEAMTKPREALDRGCSSTVRRKYYHSLVPMSDEQLSRATERGANLMWTNDYSHLFQKTMSPENHALVEASMTKHIVPPGSSRDSSSSASTIDKMGKALIDEGRARKKFILLAQLPNDPMKWRQWISNLSFEDKYYQRESLKQFLEDWPTEGELLAVKNFEGNDEELGKVDKFFFDLRVVPNLKQKLESVLFQSVFADLHPALELSIGEAERCVNQIMGKEAFGAAMQYIFWVYCIVVYGKDSADSRINSNIGFRVSALPQLIRERTEDPKMSLLQLLVRITESEIPELSKSFEELTLLRKYPCVSIDRIRVDCGSLRAEFEEKISEEAKLARAIAQASEEEDESLEEDLVDYSMNVIRFAKEAELKLQDLQTKLTALTGLRERFYVYLLEPSETPYDEVIANIAAFLEAYGAERVKLPPPNKDGSPGSLIPESASDPPQEPQELFVSPETAGSPPSSLFLKMTNDRFDIADQ